MQFVLPCVGLVSNANKTQIVLPIFHFNSLSFSGKFGVLFKDYENIFSKYDYHDSKKRN